MVPAAYPQVAAVFTQPHARAAEWLPWMRTSHFSRNAVRVATNPEVHPAYPRYSHPAVGAVHEQIQEESPSVAFVGKPEATNQQKVFVSVVAKPVPPVSVPVVKHVPEEPPPLEAAPKPSNRVIPHAEDAWDEMIAATALRTATGTPAFEEVPKKSREALLAEVSADIKDSWDASFLAGLDAA
jgi:hypothetical protein